MSNYFLDNFLIHKTTCSFGTGGSINFPMFGPTPQYLSQKYLAKKGNYVFLQQENVRTTRRAQQRESEVASCSCMEYKAVYRHAMHTRLHDYQYGRRLREASIPETDTACPLPLCRSACLSDEQTDGRF